MKNRTSYDPLYIQAFKAALREKSRKIKKQQKAMRRNLHKNFHQFTKRDKLLAQALNSRHVLTGARDLAMKDIKAVLEEIRQVRWPAKERVDRARTTKRTRKITVILGTLARIEKTLASKVLDKFPDDYIAQLQGRNLKEERLIAIRTLKAKVGQRNERKRYIAQQLAAIFDRHQICRLKTKGFSTYEKTFQACLRTLRLSSKGSPYAYLGSILGGNLDKQAK